MWDWHRIKRREHSGDRAPGRIAEDLMDSGTFLFLGARVAEDEVDITKILRDLDRLYPLYEYVESAEEPGRALPVAASQRLVSALTRTVASREAIEIEVDLQHNLLQRSLLGMLEAEFPGCPVQPEREVAESNHVDVAVHTPEGMIFCEIKVASNVRAALRAAMGQLIEYAHWPNENRALKWWVVSEETPTAEDVSYLNALRSRYHLPVFYRRIDPDAATLGPEV